VITLGMLSLRLVDDIRFSAGHRQADQTAGHILVPPLLRSGSAAPAWRGVLAGSLALALLLVSSAAVAASEPQVAYETLDTFLSPLGTIAQEERLHLLRVILILLIAVLPVLVGTPLIVWRYRRRRPHGAYAPTWDFDKRLEAAMWGVPTLIVVALGIALVHSTLRLDPYKALPGEPVNVDVVGLDWKWLFIYPDEGVASVGELVIPAGRPVSLRITSDTVMQSFFIGPLAGQIYAMPGMRTRLHLQAERPGLAEGEATQYNGPGFSQQRFLTRAVTDDAFAAWVEQAQASGTVLDERTYHRLAQRSTLRGLREDLGLDGDGPVLMSLADANLFDRVMARYHQGRPLTPAEQPGSPTFDPALASLPLPGTALYGFCGPTAVPGETLAQFFGRNDG